MSRLRESVILFVAISLLAVFGTAEDIKPSNTTVQSSKIREPLYFPPSCTTDQPLYTGKDGKPIWLNTRSLLKRSARCTAPKMPPLARSLRVEVYVLVGILVNDEGRVRCVKRVSGHPLFASAAVEAAKEWTFRPIQSEGRAVWFYGHLRFHFSTGEIKKDENSCTVARW